jgi:hypothetical protein
MADPVVQLNDVVVHIAVATVTDSAEPKPTRVIVGVIVSSGNPKLLPEYVTVTRGVMVSAAMTVLVPSDTEIVRAPPGRLGMATMTWKSPAAEVVRQPAETRLSVPLVPPFAVVQVPIVNHGTVIVPTLVMMVTGCASLNPLPVITMALPGVPDVAAVNMPFEIVDTDTAGLAACAML